MKYPHYKEIELPLLRFIFEQGGDVSAGDCYLPLGSYFELSDKDMSLTLNEFQGQGGNRSKWANMVQWARNNLAKAGLVARPDMFERGRWKLTESGVKKASGLVTQSKLPIIYPDDVSSTVIEGAKKQILVNTYERRSTARDKCIDHWGCRCVVCEFDFFERYGERGKDFIHAHHVKPLSEIGEAYELDPVSDLRPVCPNCHAMIHRSEPACSIAELKNIVLAILG